MSRVDTAAPDRLPWLPDEPSPAPVRRQPGSVDPWTVGGAIAIVVAGAFWLGARSLNTQGPQNRTRGEASTTVHLPAPRAMEPQVRISAPPEVRPVAAPEVRPTPIHEVHVVPPRPAKSHATPAPKPHPGRSWRRKRRISPRRLNRPGSCPPSLGTPASSRGPRADSSRSAPSGPLTRPNGAGGSWSAPIRPLLICLRSCERAAIPGGGPSTASRLAPPRRRIPRSSASGCSTSG